MVVWMWSDSSLASNTSGFCLTSATGYDLQARQVFVPRFTDANSARITAVSHMFCATNFGT